MRVWDISPRLLCRKHLLGEHYEIHSLWTILTQHRNGYASHPETLRWVGKLPALQRRHDRVVREMLRRGYNHRSPLQLPRSARRQPTRQRAYVHKPDEQRRILRDKGCGCCV